MLKQGQEYHSIIKGLSGVPLEEELKEFQMLCSKYGSNLSRPQC